MANQTVLIVNPTGTEYTNVNAAGGDVPARGSLNCVLTDAEQATFAAAHPEACIIGQAATPDQRREVVKHLRPFVSKVTA